MQNDNLKSYLNLHLIVFIWGFTAILGALITIKADALVWYRMFFAGIFLAIFLVFKKKIVSNSFEILPQIDFCRIIDCLALDLFFQSNSCL